MTKADFLEVLYKGIDGILDTPEVDAEQAVLVLNQMIKNLNTDTINPDHVKHPVIKG